MMFKNLFSCHLVLLVFSLFVTSCVSNPMPRGSHYRNASAVRGNHNSGPGGGKQCTVMLTRGADANNFDAANMVTPVREVCLEFSSNFLTVWIEDSDTTGAGSLQYPLRAVGGGSGCTYEDDYVSVQIMPRIHDGITSVYFSFRGEDFLYSLGEVPDSQRHRLPPSCSGTI